MELEDETLDAVRKARDKLQEEINQIYDENNELPGIKPKMAYNVVSATNRFLNVMKTDVEEVEKHG